MGWNALFDATRTAANERVWGAAVKLAREGAVQGISEDNDELHLRVKARGRAIPHEVFLWPDDPDWGCDCTLPGDICLHVCAAAISIHKARQAGETLPAPTRTYQVKLRYAFVSDKQALRVTREIQWPDGRITPLHDPLARTNVLATRSDAHAESLLAMQPAGALSAEAVRHLLPLLDGADATLDGASVRLIAVPIQFEVRVLDDDEGFRIGLYRPSGIDALYRGAALAKGALHPTSHGSLTPEQRKMLLAGVHFSAAEVGQLVGDYLPRLRERIPVQVVTLRLPDAKALQPHLRLSLAERPGGLEITSDIVYGDPPVALVKDGILKALGEVMPARNMAQERVIRRQFEARLGLTPTFRHLLAPDDAARFLSERLPHHQGPVRGKVDPRRFTVKDVALSPRLAVGQLDDGWRLDVAFDADGAEADPTTVLHAWRTGRSLVPLMDGGYAALPADWLKTHGPLLQELLAARDAAGRVSRNATAALVELLEDTSAEVPPDLHRLQSFLSGSGGLPEVVLPKVFTGELRPYQVVGLQWLRFLKDMDLHGILADDMGLGKTIQALLAILNSGGKALVVAPTSVLTNWQREAERFLPGTTVNVYHGPKRKLDDSQLTLTSYALLRIDLHLLREHDWTWLVLDEAQFIKNPTSQTARAACQLPARHRLALTGTPVENRLEELWSIFRFLMPGLLGTVQTFRDRFVRPIEAGDPKARTALRNRVRPYVLRRLKAQVATELPPLTDVVMRCEMSPPQRKIYDAVRLAARSDVQKALAERGGRGLTMQVLEALLRLRQVCCDPSLLPGDAGEGVASCKLDRLEELLVELVCDDHKLLVFSQWTGLLDRIEPRLEHLGIDWVRLDGSTRDRQRVIDRFQDPDGPPVFLLSLKAGGTGLNLTAADYVVHLDPWWNPAVQQQATDRAHRIGQDKPVVSLRLIAEGTVEERVLALQDAKRDLAEAALGTEGGFVKALSGTELRALFEEA